MNKMDEDFARELKDDDSVIKDVTLIGSDGGRVPAAKAILAIRSPVFRRMFYGDFRESSADCDSVKLDYPASVLKCVVEYCYTSVLCNESFLRSGGLKGDATVVKLVQILDAANYLELSELSKIASDELHCYPGSSCVIMQELTIRGGIGGELWSYCMEDVKKYPNSCLFPTRGNNAGIRGISFLLLETIFRSLKDKLPADVAVRALKEWNETHDSVTEEERSRLQELADAIDLKSIEIHKLAKVQPCPLFTQDRLYKAFVALGNKCEDSDDSDDSYPACNRKRART